LLGSYNQGPIQLQARNIYMPTDVCFRVRDIPIHVTLDILVKGVLERFPDEGDITIDQGRSTLVQCCYRPNTVQTAILHFLPRPPKELAGLGSNVPYEFQISGNCNIIIDKDFYGLTQLYTPSMDIKLEYIPFVHKGLSCGGADDGDSIIAISGLNGHAYGSWAAAGGADSEGRKKMWLRHFFETDRLECRTMIFGYNSRLSEPGTHTQSDYSVELLEEIEKVRKGCEVGEILYI
jgi:hypothetical protein